MSRYIVSDHPQGTPEWRLVRAGKATGSRAKDIISKIKSGEAAARRDYRVQVVVERLTGAPAEDGFVSKEMQWGTEQEPFARMALEIATGEIVQEAGFVYLPNLPIGCSVDGFIGKDGFQELKCPKSATHVTWLLGKRLPPEHEPQIIHNFFVTGKQFCEFGSFDPRMPEDLRFFRVRVERDEAKVQAYEAELMQFLKEVSELEDQLRARQPLALAA